MLRVKLNGNDSPRINQRVLENDQSLGQGTVKEAYGKNVEEATRCCGPAPLRTKKFFHILDLIMNPTLKELISRNF